jgi:hypothetical protein
MKSRIINITKTKLLAAPRLGLVAALLVLLAQTTVVRAGGGDDGNPTVLPPNSHPYGQTYGQWSADWWKWGIALAPEPGHPFIDDPAFDVTLGQQGKVWFLAAPFGTVQRTCTIPKGKALFLGLLNNEVSDLEGLGATAAERRATAKFYADHIVNVSCAIDGVQVRNIAKYRVVPPQFTFTAPTPWLFGATGGQGTAVSDGYFVMVAPLSPGQHTIHYSGAFHFTLAQDGFDADFTLDMTYHLTVQGRPPGHRGDCDDDDQD